ncbi:hypothetical protein NUJ38_14065 (plasmid) [Gluconobacter oxydans]|uniref:hypothetical protein n=1 Tax=Gluconobacter oxydans TaxID=442 RepID=UPI0026485CED|nr:hypothetical protein [Gluconobacter oxydans]WKE49681.1 hypothetical protein NUJ38_14065 [Gluconobacter oxydans]
MVWTTFHTQISRFYCHALIWQIGIMPATPELSHLNVQLHQALYHPSSIRLVQLYYGLSIVGLQLRWPALLVGGICVGLCLFFGENKQLRTVLDLEGLIEVQARMFPTLRGFARRRLTSLVAPAADAPLPADPALTVEEWRARFATAEDGSLSEVCAAEAFEQQLGPHYTTAGPSPRPPSPRCSSRPSPCTSSSAATKPWCSLAGCPRASRIAALMERPAHFAVSMFRRTS